MTSPPPETPGAAALPPEPAGPAPNGDTALALAGIASHRTQPRRCRPQPARTAAPYAVFAMQPVFAALVAVAYRRRRMPYGAHFVFSLHLNSLWFVGLLAIALLPDGPGNVLLVPMALYSALAMHRVYGGRVGATALRATGVALVYVTLLALALI